MSSASAAVPTEWVEQIKEALEHTTPTAEARILQDRSSMPINIDDYLVLAVAARAAVTLGSQIDKAVEIIDRDIETLQNIDPHEIRVILVPPTAPEDPQ